MRALLINAVCGIRSTGRICTDLAKQLEKEGYEVKIAYGRERVPEQFEKYAIRIGNNIDVYWHALMTYCLDQRGYWSKNATIKFLKWADDFNPDLLWLHNIHDHYINIEMLFQWIKSRPNMKVKWTQHDCWAFTGGCMHFVMNDCYQWKVQCKSCPKGRKRKFKYKERENYLRKKYAFTGVSQMTIVAVSEWVKKLVLQSFLNDYPIEVCYNEIDRTFFKPTYGDFRESHNLIEKKIVLGVASAWGVSKGLYEFFDLAKMLDDSYVIVLVGLNNRQIKMCPSNIIALPKTNSIEQLAEIYTSADVYVNLSKQETFGMTTLEAIACGTSVIVYKDTACEEVVQMYGGVAVEQSLHLIKDNIYRICEI